MNFNNIKNYDVYLKDPENMQHVEKLNVDAPVTMEMAEFLKETFQSECRYNMKYIEIVERYKVDKN
jgi:hypothetical protein